MPKRHLAFVALGSNLADPVRQVEKARDELSSLSRSRLLRCSGLYLSKPYGYGDQPDYVNAVAQLETGLTPRDLLDHLLDIERRHGRERSFRNSPRTLDLDILLYDDLRLDECGLHIPHPRMHERAFVLFPLAEIAPDTVLPGRGRLADALADIGADDIRLISTPDVP